jgi:hypothetical protein
MSRGSLCGAELEAGGAQMLVETSISPSNYARYCDYAIIFFQEITSLPTTKEAASVLRELFKEG